MRDLVETIERYLIAKSKGDSSAWAAKLWAIEENQRFAGKQRSQDRLFVTDVGKCHRAVKYRLDGDPRRPLSTASRMMFEQAEDIETTVAAAAKWEGILQSYQAGVDISDRENWGGRLDVVIADPLIIEVKSVRSAAFKGDKELPKPDNVTQARIYRQYEGVEVDLLYVDRGGSNPPQQYPVMPDDDAWERISAEMDELDEVRAGKSALPDCLPLVLTRRNVRKSSIDLGGLVIDWSGEIYIGPDWRCRYCDYEKCPGKRAETEMLAKMTKKDPLVLTREGKRHEDDVYEYLRAGRRELALA